jgi:hypothetical protein
LAALHLIVAIEIGPISDEKPAKKWCCSREV